MNYYRVYVSYYEYYQGTLVLTARWLRIRAANVQRLRRRVLSLIDTVSASSVEPIIHHYHRIA